MSGRSTHMNPLEARKQLLVAESELNRQQLSAEWQAMAHGVRNFAHRTKTMVAWASSTALLVAGVAALRRAPPRSRDAKSSWLQKILKGARAASTLWLAFRPLGEKHE